MFKKKTNICNKTYI